MGFLYFIVSHTQRGTLPFLQFTMPGPAKKAAKGAKDGFPKIKPQCGSLTTGLKSIDAAIAADTKTLKSAHDTEIKMRADLRHLKGMLGENTSSQVALGCA